MAAQGWWPALAQVEVGAKLGDVSAVTPDTPPLPLPLVLVAQGLELRFDLAMILHSLADLHVLKGSAFLSSEVSLLPVPIHPSHDATDDGQAGLPTDVPGARRGALLWL